jgi:hypothetical protein
MTTSKTQITISERGAPKAAAFLCDEYLILLWDEGTETSADKDGVLQTRDVVNVRTIFSEQEKPTEQILGAIDSLATTLAQSEDPATQIMGKMLINQLETGFDRIKQLLAEDGPPPQ